MTVIKIKNSNVSGRLPASGDIETAELALNIADKKLYSKDAAGAIFEIGVAGDLPSGLNPPSSGNNIGDLFYDTTEGNLVYWDGSAWIPIVGDEDGEGYVKVSGSNMTGDLTLGTDKITLGATDGAIQTLGPAYLTSTGGAHVFARMTDSLNSKQFINFNTGDAGQDIVAAMRASGSVYLGAGAAPNDANITLDATTGTASFAGNATIGSYDGSSVDKGGAIITKNGLVEIQRADKDSTKALKIIGQGTETANITSAGSASFSGAVDITKAGEVMRLGVISDDVRDTDSFIRFQKKHSSDDINRYGDITLGDDGFCFGFGSSSGGIATNQLCVDFDGISSDGSATFGKDVQCGGNPAAGTEDGNKFYKNGGLAVSAASGNLFQGFSTGDSAPTSKIQADGNAEFSGSVNTGDYSPNDETKTGVRISSAGVVYAKASTTNTTDLFRGYKGNSMVFKVEDDGGASFAGGATTIASTGSFNVNRLVATNDVITASLNGVPTVVTKADGTASFAGRVYSTRTSGTSCFQAYTTGQADAKIDLNSDGSGTFAGTINGATVGTSDARFKENITPAKPQLADVVALGGILKNFDWNDQAPLNEEIRSQRQLGLIAQEAEIVCPAIVKDIKRTKTVEVTPAVKGPKGAVIKEAVTKEENDSYKGISQDALIMKLIGAVAELSAEVTALKAVKTTKK